MATSLQDVLARGKQKAQGNKQRTAKPKPGKTIWRVLPGWDPKEPNLFFQTFGQHYIKDMAGNIVTVINCPSMTHDDPCEVCDMISAAVRQSNDDDEVKALKQSEAKQRFLLNAIAVDDDPTKPVVLEVGKMLFNQIVELLDNEDYADMLDPDKGFDIIINRTGQGLNTEYTVTPRPAAKCKPVPKSALNAMTDLGEYVQEDFNTVKKKAIEALGVNYAQMGITIGGAAAAPQLSNMTSGEDDLDDDLGGYDGSAPALENKTQDADEAELSDTDASGDTGGDDSISDEVSDDEIDDLLADL